MPKISCYVSVTPRRYRRRGEPEGGIPSKRRVYSLLVTTGCRSTILVPGAPKSRKANKIAGRPTRRRVARMGGPGMPYMEGFGNLAAYVFPSSPVDGDSRRRAWAGGGRCKKCGIYDRRFFPDAPTAILNRWRGRPDPTDRQYIRRIIGHVGSAKRMVFGGICPQTLPGAVDLWRPC